MKIYKEIGVEGAAGGGESLLTVLGVGNQRGVGTRGVLAGGFPLRAAVVELDGVPYGYSRAGFPGQRVSMPSSAIITLPPVVSVTLL